MDEFPISSDEAFHNVTQFGENLIAVSGGCDATASSYGAANVLLWLSQQLLEDGRVAVKEPLLFITDFVPHYRTGLLRALSADFDVHIAASSRNTYTDVPEARDLGDFTVHRLQVHRGPGALRVVRGALAAIRQARPSVVLIYANVWWPHVWLVSVLCRIRGVTVFHWSHGWYDKDGLLGLMFRTACYRLADHLFVFSQQSMQIGIDRAGFPEEDVSVIWNALPDRPTVDPVASPPGHVSQVLLVARLTREKRADLLVRALSVLIQNGHQIRVTIVGDGLGRAPAEALARKLGVSDYVTFTGAIYDPVRLRDIHSESSVAVVPANAGLTVIHAMRHGLPVIVSDDVRQGPEAEAVRGGYNGERFSAGSPTALAAAITTVLSDRSRWRQLANNACQTVADRYSPQCQRETVQRVLQRH